MILAFPTKSDVIRTCSSVHYMNQLLQSATLYMAEYLLHYGIIVGTARVCQLVSHILRIYDTRKTVLYTQV